MNALFFYLIQVIVTSGILYGYYHFALRNKRFHRYNRFYLLAATVISVTIPFLNIPVYFTQSATDSSFVLQTLTGISSAGSGDPVVIVSNTETQTTWFTWKTLSWLFYALIASLVLLRIVFSLLTIRRIIKNNPVEQLDKIHFINTSEPATPFSFFRWLFWNKKIDLHSEKGEQIFRHELFHIEQKHSRDIIYMELLTVIFWINPFFHLIKKEVKAIHEFLADQFAVTENKKWEYAELLLMQAFNTNQRLVNPFFHNQIKRRIAMITTSNKPSYQYFRKLMVLPVAAIVVALFAFSYKSREASSKNDYLENSINSLIPIINNLIPILDTIPAANSISVKGTIPISKIDSTHPPTPSKIVIDGKEITIKQLTLEGFETGRIEAAEFHINRRTGNENDTVWQPLVVIDGKKEKWNSAEGVLKKLDPNLIESINILKGASAINKYGEEAKAGAIEIKTKKRNEDVRVEEVILTDTIKPLLKENKIFVKVEIEPAFPGGETKWKQYLAYNTKNFNPASKGAPAGDYTVIVQFVVDKEGNIHDIKALTKFGFGMEEEAIRLIAKGPKWIPAIQNGHEVTAYKKQPITFYVGKGEISSSNKYEDPSNWIYKDQNLIASKKNAVTEIKAIARSEGKAVYHYKGRTYIFTSIDESMSVHLASFAESDGLLNSFVVNGNLVSSIDEVNAGYKRKDIKTTGFISSEDAKSKYSVNSSLPFIETYDYSNILIGRTTGKHQKNN